MQSKVRERRNKRLSACLQCAGECACLQVPAYCWAPCASDVRPAAVDVVIRVACFVCVRHSERSVSVGHSKSSLVVLYQEVDRGLELTGFS
jgi:hypothetical protein